MGESGYYNLKNKKNYLLLLCLYIITIPFQKIIWLPLVNSKIQVPEIIFVILIFLFIPQIKWADWKNIKMTTLDKAVILWLMAGTINLILNFNVTTFIELSGQFYLICLYILIQFIFFHSKAKEIELFFFFTTGFNYNYPFYRFNITNTTYKYRCISNLLFLSLFW